MDKLIERNKSYRQLIHTNDIMKLQKSSERHNKKMFEEQQKLEEKALKNQEKSFKKYVTFYFYRKSKEKEQKLKQSENRNKLIEKSEKLEEIDKKERQKRKELMIKFDTIERKKKEILSRKNNLVQIFKKKRDNYNNTCKLKKQNLIKELSDIRLDILDYQSCIMKRDVEKRKLAELKRSKSIERTLNDQINFKKNIGPFFKKLEFIKSDNISRKSVQDRRKIFIKTKKEEEERKKREDEDNMINMNLK